MSDDDKAKILDLTSRGLSARKIKERLGLTITVRSVQKFIHKELGGIKQRRLSNENSLGHARAYIDIIMQDRGKNPYLCEGCGDKQTTKCDIHHTKYENATVDDMQYLCRSCNLARTNVGLA